jgi:hypothetical protein
MDPVSIVLIVLVGLLLAWLVYRAFSNSRHAPPAKMRGGQFGGMGDSSGDFGFGQDLQQGAPGGSMARGWKPETPTSPNKDDQSR